MKKIFLLLLMFMWISILCGCKNKEEKLDNINSIIQDEDTWNKAFENFEYENFTTKVEYEYDYNNIKHIQKNEMYVCNNSFFVIMNSEYEIRYGYAEKNSHNEVKGYKSSIELTESEDPLKKLYNGYSTIEEAINKRVWIDVSDELTIEEYEPTIQSTIMKISFTDQFKDFIYNKENGTYSYIGRINAKFLDSSLDNEDCNCFCVNPVIQFNENKIIFMESSYELLDSEKKVQTKGKVEYFNIGSTTIPQDVLNEIEKIK